MFSHVQHIGDFSVDIDVTVVELGNYRDIVGAFNFLEYRIGYRSVHAAER